VLAILTVQTLVCGFAALPALLIWASIAQLPVALPVRVILLALSAAPAYVASAVTLMVVSALANRLTGAATPAEITTRIADFDWPLLRWARYLVAGHLVRLFAGSLFRGSPIWTFYLRLNGARIGRRVFVNTTAISDHNLLEFGDDVVIGADVHISGHTVERGALMTGRVRLGREVTVGVGSIVAIGASIGDQTEIGAMSLVPKHSSLQAGTVYAGIPVHALTPPSPDSRHHSAPLMAAAPTRQQPDQQ
jgi:non-ribosomal peptide synthetase-like protein